MRSSGGGGPGRSPALGVGVASAVLLAACVSMLALLAYVGTWLTFWSDEWMFLFHRADPGAASLLRGSDVHLHLFPILIYQGLFRLVGLGSYFPYLIVAWAFHLACVWLLFAVTGRLVGWGFALTAGLSLLLLGSGFEVLLQPGQMGYTLAEAAGLLALLLLMRGERGRQPCLSRLFAAAALGVGVASSAVGMLFSGLVLTWAALRRSWASLAAALAPFVLFAIWFAMWSERTTARLGLHLAHLLQVPLYIGHGLGATVSAAVGLPPYRFAALGLAIGIAAMALAWRLGARPSPLALAALAALTAEFALVAGFRPSFGIAWTARSGYLHPAVALLWLFAAGICADPRARLNTWLRPWIVAPVLALAIVGNMMQFGGAARGARALRTNEVAYLRLLETLRGSPDLDPDVGAMYRIRARDFFAAVDRFGRPRLASSEPTAATVSPANRHRMDEAIVRLLHRGFRLTAARVEGPPPDVAVTQGALEPAGPGCVRLVAGQGAAAGSWTPAAGTVALRAAPGARPAVRVGVFAPPAQPVETEGIASAGDLALRLPTLADELRWSVRIEVAPAEAVDICNAVPT
jgi:hypothetical protein